MCECRRSWRPCATPALPPKLTFFGEYRERCGDAQPHLRTAWVVHPVRVDYDVRSQRVTARCDGQDLGMTITSAMGMALEPWDLHVGAILNVLDRRVTLRNANLAVRSPPARIAGLLPSRHTWRTPALCCLPLGRAGSAHSDALKGSSLSGLGAAVAGCVCSARGENPFTFLRAFAMELEMLIGRHDATVTCPASLPPWRRV